ncbi:hypothetical protein M404DRAFT_487852 [Pisolithus tinctorius Marx 270]|uniref:Uncharacterized protein n=1 Tax=Pisolithus tinctorius Marx 270 TaxID=870435 RepID=A0A0C3I900_PISTI|nr:hypothetical protein M404DRAFT_487852 [Pisolithus tinctorius Marx 270]
MGYVAIQRFYIHSLDRSTSSSVSAGLFHRSVCSTSSPGQFNFLLYRCRLISSFFFFLFGINNTWERWRACLPRSEINRQQKGKEH